MTYEDDEKSNKWDPTIRLCNDCHWYAPIDDDKEEWIDGHPHCPDCGGYAYAY
jgi:hypothetical protein